MTLKKYWILKKFKLKPEELTMAFLLDWYGKEYILDNVAYALGKKKINDIQDPYLNNMKQKVDYLNKILKVYGFKNLFDFDSVVEKDENMEGRMKQSKLLESPNYEILMKCFGKRMYKEKGASMFSIKGFTILSDAILNEFGVGIKPTKKRKRDGDRLFYRIKYGLVEIRNGLTALI